MGDTIIRLPEVKKLIGLSAATIWRMEHTNTFPKRIKLSARAVGWRLSDVQNWISNQFLEFKP